MSRYYNLKEESKYNALLLCILAFVVVMLYLIFGFEHISIGLPIALLITMPMLWDAHRAFRYSKQQK